jgi:hypothetical protein
LKFAAPLATVAALAVAVPAALAVYQAITGGPGAGPLTQAVAALCAFPLCGLIAGAVFFGFRQAISGGRLLSRTVAKEALTGAACCGILAGVIALAAFLVTPQN